MIADTLSGSACLLGAAGAALQADPVIAGLLERYGQAIERTDQRMFELGVGAACGSCAEAHPGGCCFEGMEEGFDEVQLLIERLLGGSPAAVRWRSGACLFVGPRGCAVKVRQTFCRNFYCDALAAQLGAAGLAELRALAGEEAQRGWLAEQAIRVWLRTREPAR